jgi:molybdopterin-biosynthesis enzyme MoeA-like protein
MREFFAVIIGSEILDGRREDRHFQFLRDELSKRGLKLTSLSIVKDDPELMRDTFQFIKDRENSVLFSFGGIGATPDDFTREISAGVFRDGEMEFQNEFREKIYSKFGVENSKHRVNMSYLPKGSKLLKDNPVNGMYGYYLDDRFFFVPGFPDMAHPMIREALNNLFSNEKVELFSKSIYLKTSENSLIDWMNSLTKEITLSSLPKLDNIDGTLQPSVEIRIEAEDKELIEKEFQALLKVVKQTNIEIIHE